MGGLAEMASPPHFHAIFFCKESGRPRREVLAALTLRENFSQYMELSIFTKYEYKGNRELFALHRPMMTGWYRPEY